MEDFLHRHQLEQFSEFRLEDHSKALQNLNHSGIIKFRIEDGHQDLRELDLDSPECSWLAPEEEIGNPGKVGLLVDGSVDGDRLKCSGSAPCELEEDVSCSGVSPIFLLW